MTTSIEKDQKDFNIKIDIERMSSALSSQSFTLPAGLNQEEKRRFFTEFNAVREALSNHIEFNDELDHEMASRLLVVLDELGKEALIAKATCSPTSPVVAEPTPRARTLRCPHGVSPLNRCERCD